MKSLLALLGCLSLATLTPTPAFAQVRAPHAEVAPHAGGVVAGHGGHWAVGPDHRRVWIAGGPVLEGPAVGPRYFPHRDWGWRGWHREYRGRGFGGAYGHEGHWGGGSHFGGRGHFGGEHFGGHGGAHFGGGGHGGGHFGGGGHGGGRR